jgi:hypothetical protein
MKYPKSLFPLLALLTAGASSAAETLEATFAQPPIEARPQTWWHWVSGNVSKEGITADLEAMKKIGLGGVQLFNVDQSDVKGPVVFMSPEWRELVKHTLNEADRLKLQFAMQACEGWSESGGPWIEPAQSMQRVTWSETHVQGGKAIPLTLPKPEAMKGYYQDIAILALKDGPTDLVPAPVRITASPQLEKPVTGLPSAAAPLQFTATKGGPPFWIQYEFAQPITVGSVDSDLLYNDRRPTFNGVLEASDDGVTFRRICEIAKWPRPDDDSFPLVTAKVFRLTFNQKKPKEGYTPGELAKCVVTVSKFQLGGARVKDASARGAAMVNTQLGFSNTTLPAISAQEVIDLTGKTTWDAPAGNWTLLRFGHTTTGKMVRPATKPGLESDKLSVAAANFHIDQFFKQIWADSPDKVGSPFQFIMLDSWEAGCANWTPLMPQEFQQRRGYDLRPWLPALSGRVIGSLEQTERFLWDYRRTVADMVAENHYGVFQKRAHEKGMKLMSEAVGTGMPTLADQLLSKKYTDVPMGEFWISAEIRMDDAREAASAAHIYGQNIAAAEAYTSFPQVAAWTNDPYSLKALGDRAFANGVNLFVFHRYAHQPWLDRKPGMSMGPWGINFERTNTWWSQGSAWIDYLARCQALLQAGRFQADLCYFYGEGTPVTHRNAELSPAVPKGYDYDTCNADALLNLLEVNKEDGRITTPSGMSYRVLVLPAQERMTLPVLKKIAQLVRDGAVVYGPKPSRSPSLSGYPAVDEELAQLAAEVWGKCDGKTVTDNAYGAGKIVWGAPLEKMLGVPPDFAASKGDVLTLHRKDADADIYFVSNQETTALTADCTFRVTGKVPELWYPDTGKRETVALYTIKDGLTTLPIPFDPIGSVFVVFRTPQGPAPHAVAVSPEASLRINAQNQTVLNTMQNGDYTITLSDGSKKTASVKGLPAPMTLEGAWTVEFPPFAAGKGASIKTTFDTLTSWSDSANDTIKYFSGTATYTKTFTLPAGYSAKERPLLLDLGTVKNLAEVTLNGKPLGILWKDPFQADVTAAVKPGENILTIQITNLWPNRLIGDQKLDTKDRLTWASVSLYKATDPLLPSGLLGPVTIRPKATITVE